MKTIKERVAQAINVKLGVNYSSARYCELEDLGIIKTTYLNNDSMKDKAKIYKAKISNQDIIREMDNFMGYSVEEFLVHLGRKKCSDVYEIDNAVVEILKGEVFHNNDIESYTDGTGQPAYYYLQNSNLKIGEDLVSYHRCSRCFTPSNREFCIDDELSKIATILNIGESRLSSVNKGSYYSILLDNNQIGIWSLDLMDDFYEESEDIYRAEHHSKDFCDECLEGEYCKYTDDSLDLSKKLISDELNVPIFSIDSLLKAINRKVIYN